MFETSNASGIPGGHIVKTTMFQLGGGDLPTIPASPHTPKRKREAKSYTWKWTESG